MKFPALHITIKVFMALCLVGLSACGAEAFEFRVLSWGGSIDHLSIDQAHKPVELAAYERSLSSVYTLPVGEKLSLYRDTLVDGKTVRTPVAEFTPPETLKRAILLLARAGAGGTALVGTWIDDGEEAHPKGQIAFLNLSTLPVSIKVDTTVDVIPLRGTQLYRFPADAASVTMQAAVEKDGRAEFIASCGLRVHPDYKILVLFRNGRADPSSLSPDYIATPVEFLTFYDYIPPPVSGAKVAAYSR
ncbi:MAG: hypothetical protein WC205_12690 [Opitutaceae bacterium]|jgi:hypothetical protein